MRPEVYGALRTPASTPAGALFVLYACRPARGGASPGRAPPLPRSTQAMNRETEIKLRASRETLAALREHPLLKKRNKSGWQRHPLHNTYYDTPARELSEARVALRLRRDGEFRRSRQPAVRLERLQAAQDGLCRPARQLLVGDRIHQRLVRRLAAYRPQGTALGTAHELAHDGVDARQMAMGLQVHGAAIIARHAVC